MNRKTTMQIRQCCLLLCLFLSFSAFGQTTIWLEDFNLPNYSTSDNGATAWSSTQPSGADWWIVWSSEYYGKDLDGEATWTSEQIDISTYTDVSISIDMRESGTLESSDYIRAYYSIDGGGEVLFGAESDDFTSTTFSAANLNGNTLRIIIRARNDSNNEYYYFDNVRVEGTLAKDMEYLSSTLTQNSDQVAVGSTHQEVIGIQVNTENTKNPLNASLFSFATQGSTDAANDIVNARLYYTGTSSVFSTGNQFGGTVTSPNGTFSINGNQTLAEGTNYFWLVYDIDANATIGNLVDAVCHKLTVDGMDRIPSVTDPAGSRKINNISCNTTISSFPYSESFESGLGNWTQGTNDDINWTRNSGGTDSGSTGPSSAADGNYYLYTEASYPNNPNKSAYLISPCFDLNGTSSPTLYFSYHMQGADMGTLYLDVQEKEGVWINLFSLGGHQGVFWNEREIDLSAYEGKNIKFRFRGMTGNSYRSDIAIDKIGIESQPDMIYQSSTLTQNGNQVVVGSTDQDIIGIKVTTLNPSNPLSISSFSFDTQGSTDAANDIANAKLYYTGTSNAFATGNQFGGTVTSPNGAFTINGTQVLAEGDNYFWLVYDIDANATVDHLVDAVCNQFTIGGVGEVPAITAPAGSRKITDLDCSTIVSVFPYSESFESGIGDWIQDTGDNFNWTRNSGGTSTGSTGPSEAGQGTYYMYTEANGNTNRTANLLSPCFDLSSMTNPYFYFMYHMRGGNMGSLRVEVQENPGVSAWVTLQTFSGHQSSEWKFSQIDLSAYAGKTIKLRFRGVTGAGIESDMAIDNLFLAEKLLEITPSVSTADFAQAITGTGVEIRNLTYTSAHPDSYGTFTLKDGTQIGSAHGIVMSTGDVRDIDRPNSRRNTTTELGRSGYTDLNGNGRTTYDASFIEFDVVPSGDTLKFNYTFLSEEYTEYVNDDYNDVFAFYISGPGITGEQNIAIIPGTSTEVSINNVNQGEYTQYFVNNDLHSDNTIEDVAGFYNIEYDGYTKNLVAKIAVQSCETYHIKWVVADGNDRQYDSGVFVEGLYSNDITGASSVSEVYSECVEDPVTVEFTRVGDVSNNLTLDVNYSGSMTRGVDYTTSGTFLGRLTFSAGEATKAITITPTVLYSINQLDSIVVSLSNCSGSEFAATKVYYKPDPDLSSYGTLEICSDGESAIDPGAYANYQWKDASDNIVSTDRILRTNVEGTYTLTVLNEEGCTASSDPITIVKLPELIVAASATCQPAGTGKTQVYLSATGGGGSYQYKLSTDPASAFTSDPVFLVDNGTTVAFDILSNKGCEKTINVTTPAATPVEISTTDKTGDCVLAGDNVFYNIIDDEGNLIASIRDMGNNLGVLTAEVLMDATVQSYDGEPYLQRHYKITPQHNGLSAMVRLYLTQQEYENLALENPEIPLPILSGTNILGISKYDGDAPGSGNETFINSDLVVDGFDGDRHYIDFTVPSFSSIYIHSAVDNDPLPVRFLSVEAKQQGKHNVALLWKTADEHNNKGYEIERSVQGQTFEKIAFIEGKNVKGESAYEYTDYGVQGTVYYRLKQVDTNGDFEYSKVVSVTLETLQEFKVKVFPNPFTQQLTLEVSNPEQIPVNVQAYDATGRPVFNFTLEGSSYISKELSNHFRNLSRGVYTLRVESSNQVKYVKVVKQ
ncbi:choice-of-anchor L domain-containing protein [Rapidithrix thailandica]|uniref:Choice-of-anchor L domain-containing protein n=1 Tax=Rapidithrix thailandica TaxID=413964 RepID=A0AAW9SDV2_9BACT